MGEPPEMPGRFNFDLPGQDPSRSQPAPASLASRDAATAKLTVSVCSSETNIPPVKPAAEAGGK
jgi:hypothetical protein